MTNLQIQDLLLNSMQFVAVNAVSGGTVVAASDPSTTTPGGTVSRTLGSVIGTTATTDDSLLFTFYTPLNTSAGAALALRSFTATRRDNVIRVERQTGAEFNTLGFRVYRSDDRTRRRAVLVTPQLIAGRGRSGAQTTRGTARRRSRGRLTTTGSKRSS